MVDLRGIKNIIFDFGGVIIKIDFKITVDAFKKLGFTAIDKIVFNPEGTKLLTQMEKGLISPKEFYSEIRKLSGLSLSDRVIESTWNALLLDIPKKRIELLKKLKSKFRIFLLSNSNIIHYSFCSEYLSKTHNTSFQELFEKTWFSFNVKMTKPHLNIYRYAISDAKLIPSETLFIDDLKINVEAATKTGMKGYTLLEGEDITAFL